MKCVFEFGIVCNVNENRFVGAVTKSLLTRTRFQCKLFQFNQIFEACIFSNINRNPWIQEIFICPFTLSNKDIGRFIVGVGDSRFKAVSGPCLLGLFGG